MMKAKLKMHIPSAEQFGFLSDRFNEMMVKNAEDLVSRINLLRGIKDNQDFIQAINGCLYIYYFTYHTGPQALPNEDLVDIGDTMPRDEVAEFSNAVRRRCARLYGFRRDELLSWNSFYRWQA